MNAHLAAALADRYRIERELGAGGMATVYLAEDLKHKRKVAVKVLKPELAAVLGAERFIVEITTTAALQHPNILPLFDSGEAGGFLFYVMPFIDGETLRTKLDRETQLGVDEAVTIARDVADALDYAHSHGVVHRDIKPENILLANGRPMVADFGIALAVSAAAGGRMTETGLSLGTPHYMSPEQATAEKQITARSDVYSLASVLYEMLVGHPPHLGGSAQQIIMKIITETAPSVTTLRKSVPQYVAAAIAQALEKLPADRFSSAKEFADALLGRSAQRTGVHGARAVPRNWRERMSDPMLLSMTAVAVLAIGAAAWTAVRPPARPTPAGVQFVLTSQTARPVVMNSTWPAVISPNGRDVVYAGDAGTGDYRLYARRVDDLAVRALLGTEGATQPIFSPDGQWIAFHVGGQLRKMNLQGGPVIPVMAASSLNGATWTPGGEIVLGSEGATRGLTRVSDAGGVPIVITKPERDLLHVWPMVLQDGKSILFTIWEGSGKSNFASRIAVTSLDDGVVHPLGLAGVRVLGAIGNQLVYLQADGTVMAVSFDQRRKQVNGKPVPVLDSIPLCRNCNGDAPIYLSSSGALSYIRGTLPRRLTWVDATGAARTVTTSEQPFSNPRVSPDGRRIAVTVEARLRDIWIYEIASATWTRLTTGGDNFGPEWSADGSSVVFISISDGEVRAWARPADGSGSARRLSAPSDGLKSALLSPDGKTLLLSTFRDNISGVWSGAIGETSVLSPIDTSQSWAGLARFSPDGRQLAHISAASGQYEVYVSPFPSAGGRMQVSLNGGSDPVWSRDGRRLFYLAGRRMMVATLTPPPNVRVQSRDSLFTVEGFADFFAGAGYDVSADGKSLLMLRTDDRHIQLVIALNWANSIAAKQPR